MPVFIDSPLATKVTEIYKKYAMDDFNEELKAEIRGGDGSFDFPRLKFTVRMEDSIGIENFKFEIIIAGSGNVLRQENCSTRKKESFV